MALSVKVGTFTNRTSTGSLSVTGVGFQPTALILFTAPVASDDGSTSFLNGSVCFTDGTNSRANCWQSDHDVANADAANIRFNNRFLSICNDNSTNNNKIASLTSLDSDGFTLNYTTASAAATRVGYIALAGSDITNVKVGSVTITNGTGSQSFTGVGFQPKMLFLVGTSNSNLEGSSVGNVNPSIGFALSSSQQACVAITSQSGPTTSNTWGVLRSDRCHDSIPSTGGNRSASLTSMDSDGFTINKVESTGADTIVYYLALGGTFQAKIGVETQKTSTGTKATTGVGFQPKILVFGSTQRVADSTVTADAFLTLGTGDGSSEAVMANTDHDNLGTTQTGKSYSNAKVLRHITVGSGASPTITTVSEADLSSLDSDGFTLDWTTADGTAREFFYLGLAAAAGIVATPATLALTTSQFAPTVSVSDNKLATPTTKALTLTTFAPTITVGVLATPTTRALTVTTFAPTIVAPQLCTPATVALTLTLNNAVFGVGYVPATKTLTTATFAPSIVFGTVARPSTLALRLFSYQPEIRADFDPGEVLYRFRPEDANIYRSRPGDASDYRFRPDEAPRSV